MSMLDDLVKNNQVEKEMQQLMNRYGIGLDELKNVIKNLENKESERRRTQPPSKEQRVDNILENVRVKLGQVYGDYCQRLDSDFNDAAKAQYTKVYLKMAGIRFSGDPKNDNNVQKLVFDKLHNRNDNEFIKKISQNLYNRMDENGDFLVTVKRSNGAVENDWKIDMKKSIEDKILGLGLVWTTKKIDGISQYKKQYIDNL